MKNKKYNILFLVFFIFFETSLCAYEIQIEKGPSIDAGPSTFPIIDFYNPTFLEDNESLISWLGGKENIKRILIGTPHMNINQVVFTESYIRNRFEKSICINTKKDAWSYAPLTMGTIYFVDGAKTNFTMYLSGISIAKNLFALDELKEVQLFDGMFEGVQLELDGVVICDKNGDQKHSVSLKAKFNKNSTVLDVVNTLGSGFLLQISGTGGVRWFFEDGSELTTVLWPENLNSKVKLLEAAN